MCGGSMRGAYAIPLARAVHFWTAGRQCGNAAVSTADDSYRTAGVYAGQLNALADPMPAGTYPDNCDRVVTVNGDTRLDIDLVRR